MLCSDIKPDHDGIVPFHGRGDTHRHVASCRRPLRANVQALPDGRYSRRWRRRQLLFSTCASRQAVVPLTSGIILERRSSHQGRKNVLQRKWRWRTSDVTNPNVFIECQRCKNREREDRDGVGRDCRGVISIRATI